MELKRRLKHSVLPSADPIARAAFSFNEKLPTYCSGHWIWLSKTCWPALYPEYEPFMIRSIQANLSSGDVFWDVGANIGVFSLIAAKIVGPNGSVFSFEPSPDVFLALQSNTIGDNSIKIFPYGIGNADGSASFVAQGMSAGSSFIEEVTEMNRRYHPGEAIRQFSVTIKKLDTLLSDLRPPSLVKIDVEGFEFEVLKGSARLLSDIRPTLIIEIHPPQLRLSGGSEELLFETLEKHHYGRSILYRNPNSLFTIIAKPLAV
jgi:FkbM family methyltransferase